MLSPTKCDCTSSATAGKRVPAPCKRIPSSAAGGCVPTSFPTVQSSATVEAGHSHLFVVKLEFTTQIDALQARIDARFNIAATTKSNIPANAKKNCDDRKAMQELHLSAVSAFLKSQNSWRAIEQIEQ
jgi:hypothetical protein